MEAGIPGDRLLLQAGTQTSNQPPGGVILSAYPRNSQHTGMRQIMIVSGNMHTTAVSGG